MACKEVPNKTYYLLHNRDRDVSFNWVSSERGTGLIKSEGVAENPVLPDSPLTSYQCLAKATSPKASKKYVK
jgi:hypothetical protein